MFDRYVEAQAVPPGRRARQIVVTVSVALHAIAVLGLIVYSFFHVEEVAPPLLTVTFFSAQAPPPPPPPPPPAAKKHDTKPKPKFQQPTKVEALVQPKEPEKEEEPEEDEGVEGGVEGGVPGGVAGGAIGGVGSAPAPPPPPPPKPKNIAHEPDPDQWIDRPDPHLPDAIKTQRKGGEAIFRGVVCVDTGGHVTNVRVLSGIPGADDSIVSTMHRWRLKSQPIPICFPVQLIFSIE